MAFKNLLLGKQVQRAVCDALDVDYHKQHVCDVSIDIGRDKAATASVTFILDGDIVEKISNILKGKNETENQS